MPFLYFYLLGMATLLINSSQVITQLVINRLHLSHLVKHLQILYLEVLLLQGEHRNWLMMDLCPTGPGRRLRCPRATCEAPRSQELVCRLDALQLLR